jgi:hypothetical protein
MGSTSNYIYFTGIQIEVGSSATSFDYRPYGTELALCQRYYIQYVGGGDFAGVQNGTTQVNATYCLPVPLRASPTVALGGSSTNYAWTQGGAKTSTSTTISVSVLSTNALRVLHSGYTGLSDGYVANLALQNTLTISAEL